MTEERKNNPKLDLKDIQLFKEPLKMTLDCAHAIKTGETQYGTWNLWIGIVENQKVWEGPKNAQKPVEGYSGKVIFFPTEKLNEALLEATAGNTGVQVNIYKEAEEGQMGLIKRYRVEKLSEGTVDTSSTTSSLTPSEMKVLSDLEEFKNSGFEITDVVLQKMTEDPKYGGMSMDRLKVLVTKIKSDN